MGVEAKAVLVEHLGSGFEELEDIQEYLISIVEESSNDEESVQTLASMLEAVVEEGEAENISKKIIDQYNQANDISTKTNTNQNRLLGAPINVGESTHVSSGRDWVKQPDQVCICDNIFIYLIIFLIFMIHFLDLSC